MRIMRFALLCFIWAHVAVSSASSYFFRNVDVKDGLSGHFVRDVARDSYGYIWFSTINGLSRYDGHRFLNFIPISFGARSNDVTKVCETADSVLWMVSIDELFTYDRAKVTWQKDGAQRLKALGVEGAMKRFYVDESKNLWVVTDNRLYYYDYSRRKMQAVNNHAGASITHIVSKGGNAVVVTQDFKVYLVSLKENRLVPITEHPSPIANNRDNHVYLDNHQNLWFYNSHSLAGVQWIFSLKSRQWRQVSELKELGNVMVNYITEDNNGHLWLGTGNAGIQIVEYRDDQLAKVSELRVFMSQSSHITCLYLDDTNTMWVGSAKLGASFTDMSCPSFWLVPINGHEDVSALMEDAIGNLWIGFDGGGVMMKSPTGMERFFSASTQGLPSDIVTSMALDANGAILVGSYGGGIAKFNGQRFVPLYSENTNLNYVKAMLYDRYDNLWVATVDRGLIRVRRDGRMDHFTSENSPLLSNGLLCLACDSLRDVIYIGTSAGVCAFDGTNNRFATIEPLAKLKDMYVSTLMVDNNNRLWIGSREGLWVYGPQDGSVSHFTTEEGLSHNSVSTLVMPKGQNASSAGGGAQSSACIVWAGTDNGLTCISTQYDEGGKVVYQCYPFYDSDGLQDVVFSTNAAMAGNDGTVLLGCYKGYVTCRPVFPASLAKSSSHLRVQFTDFRVNGKEAEGSLADFTIRYGERPSIFVSAMVPTLVRKVRYLYRFKGEEEWVRAPGNMLYFVALNPGKHILQVKAELPGMTTSPIAELPIRVKPPFWMSTPAIIFYILLLAALVYLVYRAMRRRQERELAYKQLEMNMEKYEMEEEKIRFFTNISHDLKTPLTLVVAPLEKIRDTPLPESIRTEIDVAWRNAKQLYELILQLLDFRRLDVGKEKLLMKHGDIVSFVKQTVQGFAYYSTRKQIQLKLNVPPKTIEINFDENKMRRIITNLLSNAYKYNTDNGSVTVGLEVNEQTDGQQLMKLSVADTGIGVHDKRHIFDRFVQETHGREQEGSGLGLHIVKQYVELMGGQISVADNHPKGSVFTVTLPVESTPVEQPQVDAVASQPSRTTILVVDDNSDAR
ncbi:MAG: hypothetical protein K5893_08905, partial [Prevotella sp.]|nr:hypothetical protein [Prevotella sp.]